MPREAHAYPACAGQEALALLPFSHSCTEVCAWALVGKEEGESAKSLRGNGPALLALLHADHTSPSIWSPLHLEQLIPTYLKLPEGVLKFVSAACTSPAACMVLG